MTRFDLVRRGLVLDVVAILRGDVFKRGQALPALRRVPVLLARRRKRGRVRVVVHHSADGMLKKDPVHLPWHAEPLATRGHHAGQCELTYLLTVSK